MHYGGSKKIKAKIFIFLLLIRKPFLLEIENPLKITAKGIDCGKWYIHNDWFWKIDEKYQNTENRMRLSTPLCSVMYNGKK